MNYKPHSALYPLHRIFRARRGGWIVARYSWSRGRTEAHVPTRDDGLDLIDTWSRGGDRS
jgi:hypothetical protein